VEGPYRALPWQVCHNDVTPANVLVDAGRVTAVLDFEFAAPAARALDIAMGLRMTMQVWENSEPWEAVRRFCHGYTRWTALTDAEVTARPWLIRLRGAITVLWWIGRTAAVGDAGPIPARIQYMRNFVHWLDRYEQRFVDVVMQEAL
jgi:Ser/Thr protein kinase RdoA (MazF antagonist)